MRLANLYTLIPSRRLVPPSDTAASTKNGWPSCDPGRSEYVATNLGLSSLTTPSDDDDDDSDDDDSDDSHDDDVDDSHDDDVDDSDDCDIDENRDIKSIIDSGCSGQSLL